MSRKFNFTCVYVFHTLYHTRCNWQTILSQTKILNIFPGSLKISSVIKILSCSYCYYNYNKKDRAFNRFLVVRKQTSTGKIIFSIVNLIDKSNKFEDSFYKIGNELRKFDNDRVQFKHRIREFDQTNIKLRQSGAGRKSDNNRKPRQICKKSRFLSR